MIGCEDRSRSRTRAHAPRVWVLAPGESEPPTRERISLEARHEQRGGGVLGEGVRPVVASRERGAPVAPDRLACLAT